MIICACLFGRNAQREGQHRGEQCNGQTAAQATYQSGNGQNRVDAGTGDQLSEAFGQSLERNEQCQHNGGFGNKADFLVHYGEQLLPG